MPCDSAIKIGENWAEDPTHSSSGTDGADPYSGVIQGRDGNFYSITEFGGDNGSNDGTVFQLNNSSGVLTTLYSFCKEAGCADGENPYDSLIQGAESNFYGTTAGGGAYGKGTAFQLTVSGDPPSGALTTLYSFGSQA